MQRERILQKFAKAQLKQVDQAEQDDVSLDIPSDVIDEDGPSTSNPLACMKLPTSTQYSMWAKVQAYLDDQSSYTQSPGISDFSSVLVKSTSSDRPHFVQKVSANVYRCNKECLMFKSTNGICSHSLLVASLNGQVDNFVRHYAKSKAPVNYAKHGLPLGGKKPSKSKASSTSAVKNFLTLADDLQQSKRARASSGPPHVTKSASIATHYQHSQCPTYGVGAAQVHLPNVLEYLVHRPHLVLGLPLPGLWR